MNIALPHAIQRIFNRWSVTPEQRRIRTRIGFHVAAALSHWEDGNEVDFDSEIAHAEQLNHSLPRRTRVDLFAAQYESDYLYRLLRP
jgi:hypothetical protein